MKKKHIIYLILIAACVLVFFAYRGYENMASDNRAPKITVPEGIKELTVNSSETELLADLTATDDKDGDVTSSLVVESVQLTGEKGKAKVSIAAFDKSGNVSKVIREVVYTDYESPKFTLTSSLTFSQNSGTDVLNIIKVNDIFDGDISHRIRATTLDEESITSPGVHNVEFRVTNSLGDTAELVLPVEVYSQGTYNASLSLSDYIIYLKKGDAFNKTDYLGSFTIGNEKTNLGANLPSGFYLRTEGEVNTDEAGVYSLSYYVTYQSQGTGYGAGQSYKGFSKLIVVVEE
ncbi:MAG: hypothetical protein J6M16_11060 [Clostridia bacterium]|nr:hypothetical protein [Clostridia bacterium]